MDLYRFFSADGQLLYIGISLNAATRADDHRRHQPWWPDAARMDVEHLGDVSRVEAERVERQAIERESPLHNVRHNHGAVPSQLMWMCDYGDGPVANGKGYVAVEMAAAHKLHERREQQRALERTQTVDGVVKVDLSAWQAMGHAVPWFVMHRDCDPLPDRPDYWFDVARCRRFSELLDWNAHLHGKRWISATNWDRFICRVSNPCLQPSHLAPSGATQKLEVDIANKMDQLGIGVMLSVSRAADAFRSAGGLADRSVVKKAQRHRQLRREPLL